MSTWNIPGVKTAGVWGWQPRHFHVSNVMTSGSLNLLENSGPDRASYGSPVPSTCISFPWQRKLSDLELRYFELLLMGGYKLAIKWTANDYFTFIVSRFVSLKFIAIFKTDSREGVILKFKLASWCLSVLTNNRQVSINRKLIVETRTEKSPLYSS
jgi:hypothetical protein